jgi:predicted molibdopterin-dependent oxidoreductase YjgC
MPLSTRDSSDQPDPSSADGLRIDDPALRGRPVRMTFEGETIEAYEGESIAAALLAAGHRALRTTGVRGEPRGLFCNMGICYECLVQVDERPNVRACQTPVAEGLRIKRQQDTGSWEPGS